MTKTILDPGIYSVFALAHNGYWEQPTFELIEAMEEEAAKDLVLSELGNQFFMAVQLNEDPDCPKADVRFTIGTRRWQPGEPTPGPWIVEIAKGGLDSEGDQVTILTKAESVMVAVLPQINVDDIETLLPDAYLMAAAPELLAMLKAVRVHCPISVQETIDNLLTRIAEQENP